jgi:hypothetical protein
MNRIILICFFACTLGKTVVSQTEYGFPVQATIKNGIIEGNYNTPG